MVFNPNPCATIVSTDDIVKYICAKHGVKYVIHAINMNDPEPILFHLERRSSDDSYVEENIMPNPKEKPFAFLKRIGWAPEVMAGEKRSEYLERIKHDGENF
jgi:hypothetical protein